MREWVKKNRQRWLDYKRKQAYGPNAVEYFASCKKQQKGKCAVCKRRMTKANQDHNHTTNKLRGVLCNWCNTGLAFVENKGWMRRANRYLRVWK